MQLEPEGLIANPMLLPLPTPPETAQWWLITPSPLLFENIGTSRPLQTLTESGSFPLFSYQFVYGRSFSIMKVEGLNSFPVRSVILGQLDGVRKEVPSSGLLALALHIEGNLRTLLTSNKISPTYRLLTTDVRSETYNHIAFIV